MQIQKDITAIKINAQKRGPAARGMANLMTKSKGEIEN